MKRMVFLLATMWGLQAVAQQLPKLERIEPANWWVGMQYHQIQLIVHGAGIATRSVQMHYPGVQLLQVHPVENPNYLFIDLDITASALPGTFPIIFSKKGEKDLIYTYTLRARNNGIKAQGVTSKDLIYLIMPDRFANGDVTNDVVKGMAETTLQRDSMYDRHGGDIQGVIDHLDYLKDLGVTAVWLTPVVTNDEPHASYHGYASTENYKIDPRYGSNELYKKLADALHQRGMKLIQDLVHNHMGSNHWTVLDKPAKDWVHQWPTYTRSNFREQTIYDPYGAKADKKIMTDGWFDRHMPDMNENNPYLQKYITQSHIWWVEYAGVDGFRLDTYAYNDADFMAAWGKTIKTEYPQISIFGETLVHGMPNQVAFTQGNTVHRGFNTELPGVTDYQLLWAISDALNAKENSWDDGVVRLYNTLASDYQYQDPTRNVVFLDNHDVSRFYSVIGENTAKYKAALAWLLTTRGVPEIYYGTELMMKNFSNPDGLVREDFKGGWVKDSVNKFTPQGRNSAENSLFNYLRTLATYRRENTVLQTGKLMQYIPENGVYTYFRYDSSKTLMMIMNGNNRDTTITTARFEERTQGYSRAVNVITKENLPSIETVAVPAYTTLVLELRR
ncbi:Glycosidase [Chitinophaga costaii]|uniref:Glycosidase n=1 Tax=Chitinophaga costaii TaxID=1335309 RepID=A0A1C4BI47_9BACT|nr:glycoside hydrolase family 13 protein [Chitinophaga costaii]PUZ27600.1 alpha-amylase [Chitinophaga costaii]SCC06510.1 Glycosidase [Chitinophaga costaii]